jgi:hypothetical protein
VPLKNTELEDFLTTMLTTVNPERNVKSSENPDQSEKMSCKDIYLYYF